MRENFSKISELTIKKIFYYKVYEWLHHLYRIVYKLSIDLTGVYCQPFNKIIYKSCEITKF